MEMRLPKDAKVYIENGTKIDMATEGLDLILYTEEFKFIIPCSCNTELVVMQEYYRKNT